MIAHSFLLYYFFGEFLDLTYMAKTISILNQTEGVGKSIVSINIGYELAEQQKKTLVIDLDPQAYLSSVYCKNIDKEKSIGIIFESNNYSIETFLHSANIQSKFLDIIPSTIHLALISEKTPLKVNKEKVLIQLIKKVDALYDYIIIDCQSTLGILPVNAIHASNIIIIPTNFKEHSLDGMNDLLFLIQSIKMNHSYKYFLLRNMYERRNRKINRIINHKLNKNNTYLLDTVIRKNEAINQAQKKYIPVKKFDYHSNGAHDFQQLVTELRSYI